MENLKNITKNKKTSTVLDFIILACLSLIFFTIPLFFTGMVAQGWGFEKMILFYFLVLIALVAWVTKGVVEGSLKIKRTPLDIPIFITLMLFLFSTFLSVNKQDSLLGSYGSSSKGLVATFIFILFYYLMVNNLNYKRVKYILFSFLSSVFLLIVYYIFQVNGVYILPMDFTHNEAFNPLGSLSALTMFLVFVLPVLVAIASQIERIFPALTKPLKLTLQIILSLGVLGDLLILASLNGFVSWFSALMGVVIVLMFFLSKVVKVKTNDLLIPLISFLVLIAFLVMGNFNLLKVSLPAEVSLSRSASWDIAKNSVKENPFFGSGPSTFYYDFSKFKNPNFNLTPLWNIRFDSASGALFEMIATVGVLGAFAVVVLVLISLSMIFISLIKNKEDKLNSVLLGFLGGFVSLVIISLSYSVNNSIILISILFIVFALSLAVLTYPERFPSLTLSFKASPNFALALAAIFLGVSAGVVVLFTLGLKIYIADIYAKKALLAPSNEKKIEYMEKSIALAPYRDIYYLSLANNYMAEANKLAINGGDQAQIGDFLNKAIDYGKKAVEIAPNKASNNESLALIYENASFYTKGALKWAESLYQKVADLDPNNPNPYLRLALINMANANKEQDPKEREYYIKEAIKQYDKAIAKKLDMSAAHYGKAVAYEKLNQLDNAINELGQAVISANNNVDYMFELGRLYFNKGMSAQNISQKSPNDITENKNNQEQLSVNQNSTGNDVKSRNQYINNAEQLFLGVLKKNPNYANALYSLTLLYQKVGEKDKAKPFLDKLLKVLQDNNQKDLVKQQFADLLK